MKLRPSFLAALVAAAPLHLALPARAALAPIESSRTPRGSLLLVQRDRTAPRVALSLVLRAGAADEAAANAGWRRLLVDAMLQSTRDPAAAPGAAGEPFLSSARLRDRMEALGGRLTAQVGDDAIELSVVGPSSRGAELLDVLMAVATQPRLGEADIDRARRALVRRLSEDPAGAPDAPAGSGLGGVSVLEATARALRRLEERLYRDASGAPVAYALPPAGTLQSLSNLDAAQVRVLFRQYFAPSRRVLSLAGDVDVAGLRARASQLEAAGEWSVAPESKPAFAPVPASPPLEVLQESSPSASVFLSYPVNSEALSPRDMAALQVLAAALGESPQARLPRRLSDPAKVFGSVAPQPGDPRLAKIAFAIRLSAQWVPRSLRGEFVLWAQTGPQQVEAVKNALLEEMAKIRDGALTPAELAAAKSFARGAFATDRELLRERASRNALEAARSAGTGGGTGTGAGADWTAQLPSLSARDVQEAARKYLRAYAVALVMPAD